MRRSLLSLALVLLLLAGGISVFASEAGGPNDPLVSKSYAQTWAEGVLRGSTSSIASKLRPIYDNALSYAQQNKPETSAAEKRAIYSGGAVTLSTGASVTVLSGSARVSIVSGAVVNATVGAACVNGNLNQKQLYIACENTSATVTAASDCVLLLDGSYKVSSSGRITFSDVPATEWYYENVYSAVESGLIEGYGDGSFRPKAQLTLAAAVKLAACMHQLHNEGAVSFREGDPWYKVYVDYAVRNGIVDGSYSSLADSKMNAAVSRRDYVVIFYKALPASEFAKLNSIADGAIPDVGSSAPGAAEIYAFYRAGIVEGSSSTPGVADHSFLPDNSITRSEVTAVISRMLDPTVRSVFTIG